MVNSIDALYKFSRYLRWKQRGTWVAIFHELHPDCIYLPLDIWHLMQDRLTSVPQQLIDDMRRRNLLITSDQEDDDELASAKSGLNRLLNRASILYLVLIQGCNFNCSYCPIPLMGKQKGNTSMTPETVRAAIDLWVKHIQRDDYPDAEYFVIFYGGEPLLNRQVVIAGLDYITELRAEKKLPPVNLLVSTNGVLVDLELIELFKKHGVMVSIGCDGPKEFHDRTRRDTDGQATFAKVAQAIRLLVKHKIRTFASVSITPYNVNAIEHFSNFFEQYGIEKFGFNFLQGKLIFSLVPESELDFYYEKATDGAIQNFLNSGGRHLETQVERKYIAYYGKQFFPTDCSGYGNQLVIQPDGQISNCPFLCNDMGSVRTVTENFRLASVPLVQEWRKRLPLYNIACRVCEAKGICGGGCALNALEIKGDLLMVDDAMCLLTRKLFDRFIWSNLPSTQVE